MRIHKITLFLMSIVLVLSLVICFGIEYELYEDILINVPLLYGHKEFYINCFIGIMASTILVIITSSVCYFIEKARIKKEIKKIYTLNYMALVSILDTKTYECFKTNILLIEQYFKMQISLIAEFNPILKNNRENMVYNQMGECICTTLINSKIGEVIMLAAKENTKNNLIEQNSLIEKKNHYNDSKIIKLIDEISDLKKKIVDKYINSSKDLVYKINEINKYINLDKTLMVDTQIKLDK